MFTNIINKTMQSLRRQIRRGNACLCIDPVTKNSYVSQKKGSPSERNIDTRAMTKVYNRDNIYYRSQAIEERYIKEVTSPIIKRGQ